MRFDQSRGARGKIVLREFIEAVLALSYDPASTNVVRYLAASEALEGSRPRRRTKARARAERAA